MFTHKNLILKEFVLIWLRILISILHCFGKYEKNLYIFSIEEAEAHNKGNGWKFGQKAQTKSVSRVLCIYSRWSQNSFWWGKPTTKNMKK